MRLSVLSFLLSVIFAAIASSALADCGFGQGTCPDGGCVPLGSVCCGGNQYCPSGNVCIENGARCLPRGSPRLCSDGHTYCNDPAARCVSGNHCLSPGATLCSDGRICDAGSRCSRTQGHCIPLGKVECSSGSYCNADQVCTADGGGCRSASAPPPAPAPAGVGSGGGQTSCSTITDSSHPSFGHCAAASGDIAAAAKAAKQSPKDAIRHFRDAAREYQSAGDQQQAKKALDAAKYLETLLGNDDGSAPPPNSPGPPPAEPKRPPGKTCNDAHLSETTWCASTTLNQATVKSCIDARCKLGTPTPQRASRISLSRSILPVQVAVISPR